MRTPASATPASSGWASRATVRIEKTDVMATTIADLSDLLKDIPAGAWVAISERQHKTIAFGVDARAVLNEAKEKGEQLPLMVRVPDRNTAMFL